MTDKTVIDVETGAGVKTLWLNVENGVVESVRVCMGTPTFEPASIPVDASGTAFIDQPVEVGEMCIRDRVVGHAGVEDRVDAHVDQRPYVPVSQLGREADRVAGDGRLAGQVQAAAGHGAAVHREAQLREEGVPEREQLPHIQSQRDAYLAPAAFDRLVGEYQLALVLVEVQLARVGLSGNGAVAAVAAYVGLAVGEGVDLSLIHI